MSEKTAIQRQRKFVKEDKGLVDKACHALMASPDGRKFLWWLLGVCRDGELPRGGTNDDTNFLLGHFNVAQQLKSRLIEVEPSGYINLLKEMQDEQRNRAGSVRKLASADDTGSGYSFDGDDHDGD